MNDNVGWITGTHVGDNNLIYSKVSLNQVRKALTDPKAVPRVKGAKRVPDG